MAQPTLTITVNGTVLTLASPEQHPTDDPNIPSYQCDQYKAYARDVAFVHDMEEGKRAWFSYDFQIVDETKTQNYIPQDESETESDLYSKRIARTRFTNSVAPSVDGLSGFLVDFNPTDDLTPEFAEALDDVDLGGTDIYTFCEDADQLAIRDGFCGLLVEMEAPPTDEQGNSLIRTNADLIQFRNAGYPFRPYLALVERKDLINWAIAKHKGRTSFSLVTIVEWHEIPLEGFATTTHPFYRIYYADGTYELWAIALNNEKKVYGALIDSGQNSIRELPLVIYDAHRKALTNPPLMLDIADLSLAYYHLYAEYRAAMHKLNLPVPVRKGLIQPGETDFSDLPPISLGVNTGIDVTSDGDFYWAVPARDALDTTKAELDAIALEINRKALRFLSGNQSVAPATATEVTFQATHSQSILMRIATRKENSLNKVARLWAMYTGNPNQNVGGFAVNSDMLRQPLTDAQVERFSQMALRNQMSLPLLYRVLKEGKALPRDVDVDTEISLIPEVQNAISQDQN